MFYPVPLWLSQSTSAVDMCLWCVSLFLTYNAMYSQKEELIYSTVSWKYTRWESYEICNVKIFNILYCLDLAFLWKITQNWVSSYFLTNVFVWFPSPHNPQHTRHTRTHTPRDFLYFYCKLWGKQKADMGEDRSRRKYGHIIPGSLLWTSCWLYL